MNYWNILGSIVLLLEAIEEASIEEDKFYKDDQGYKFPKQMDLLNEVDNILLGISKKKMPADTTSKITNEVILFIGSCKNFTKCRKKHLRQKIYKKKVWFKVFSPLHRALKFSKSTRLHWENIKKCGVEEVKKAIDTLNKYNPK